MPDIGEKRDDECSVAGSTSGSHGCQANLGVAVSLGGGRTKLDHD